MTPKNHYENDGRPLPDSPYGKNYDDEVNNNVTAYDYTDKPIHYDQWSMETWDRQERIYGTRIAAAAFELIAMKYTDRVGFKPNNPIERDIKKRNKYLEKRNELLAKIGTDKEIKTPIEILKKFGLETVTLPNKQQQSHIGQPISKDYITVNKGTINSVTIDDDYIDNINKALNKPSTDLYLMP